MYHLEILYEHFPKLNNWFFPHLSLVYSTLLTLAIKVHAVVNSSLFSSKYFHFYNVEVVGKASSKFPQHHMILTCLTLCKPLIPLVSHISALFFKQVPKLTLFKIGSKWKLSSVIAMVVLCPAHFQC